MTEETTDIQIKVEQITLGTMVLKFTLPMMMVDQINEICDNKRDRPFNSQLAGKIEEEFDITQALSDDTKKIFLTFFEQYIKQCNKPFWKCYLDNVWFNDMKAGEYNPIHFHRTHTSDVGLSSVLMLKRPKTYGKEYSVKQEPRNGYLNLISGTQDPLAASMYQVDMEPGDFFIFPFTLLHSVNPFNGTDEIRRTLSYNCNLYRDGIWDLGNKKIITQT